LQQHELQCAAAGDLLLQFALLLQQLRLELHGQWPHGLHVLHQQTLSQLRQHLKQVLAVEATLAAVCEFPAGL
jgi:hypothetical protein